MLKRGWQHEGVRNATGYALALTLSVALLAQFMRLWEADLTVPFGYTSDAFSTAMLVRTVLDHGWYLANPRIGMPFGGEMYDYPLPDALHFVLFKFLGWFGANHVVVVNLYYLLTFPLTALISYFVLRHFERGRLAALVASLLFTFLPYHFLRCTHHLFLAGYYLIPLIVMVSLWVYREPGLLFAQSAGGDRWRLTPFSWRVLAGIVVCLLLACGGIYYAFFGCVFLAAAGLWRAAAARRWQPLASAAFFLAVVVGGGLLNLMPNLFYTSSHGRNPVAGRRDCSEAEVYALRLTQLILPIHGHRVRVLRHLRARYDLCQPLRYEITDAGLGIVGSAGLLLLLARLFYRRPLTAAPELEDGLTVLNGSGFLLGTFGGFGSLFALTVTPSIRAYTRISIFLAFLALFAVVLLVEKLARRYQHTVRGRWTLRLALLLLLALGLYDQTTPAFFFIRAQRTAVQPQYASDAAFVQALETRLPAGAMVFQLPYVPFPESVPPGKMKDYDHFRAYLLSQSLRWSYGAMKGRPADTWQATAAALPLEDMVRTLVGAGFSGIYIDRHGYADGAAKLEADLRDLLRTQPLRSADARLLFFDLSSGYGSEWAGTATVP